MNFYFLFSIALFVICPIGAVDELMENYEKWRHACLNMIYGLETDAALKTGHKYNAESLGNLAAKLEEFQEKSDLRKIQNKVNLLWKGKNQWDYRTPKTDYIYSLFYQKIQIPLKSAIDYCRNLAKGWYQFGIPASSEELAELMPKIREIIEKLRTEFNRLTIELQLYWMEDEINESDHHRQYLESERVSKEMVGKFVAKIEKIIAELHKNGDKSNFSIAPFEEAKSQLNALIKDDGRKLIELHTIISDLIVGSRVDVLVNNFEAKMNLIKPRGNAEPLNAEIFVNLGEETMKQLVILKEKVDIDVPDDAPAKDKWESKLRELKDKFLAESERVKEEIVLHLNTAQTAMNDAIGKVMARWNRLEDQQGDNAHIRGEIDAISREAADVYAKLREKLRRIGLHDHHVERKWANTKDGLATTPKFFGQSSIDWNNLYQMKLNLVTEFLDARGLDYAINQQKHRMSTAFSPPKVPNVFELPGFEMKTGLVGLTTHSF